ncbi:MAG: hypothetical protein E6I84_15940 [Chloroflexi bacterium]|nr:MAG: hypothetical protein E6I84_15940 [Chloroflexota bacterium]
MKGSRLLGLLFCGLLLAACTPGVDPLKNPLTSIANIQLPPPGAEAAGSPSLDLLTVDTRNELLYVPYSNTLDIVDLRSRTVKGQVPNLPGIKSIALSPDPNIVFTGNGGDNRVAVIDVAKLKVIDEVMTPVGNPDAMLYDATNDTVVVSQSGPSPNLTFIGSTPTRDGFISRCTTRMKCWPLMGQPARSCRPIKDAISRARWAWPSMPIRGGSSSPMESSIQQTS